MSIKFDLLRKKQKKIFWGNLKISKKMFVSPSKKR